VAVGYKQGSLTPDLIAADKAAKKEVEGEEGAAKKSGKLPDDFPGHAALEEAGITTYAQVRKAQKADELKDVSGIGDATLANIAEALD
jgi:predicted flap endonuclease-1-like 5' DNA nuclease